MNLTADPQRLIAAALIALIWIGWVWWTLRKAQKRGAASGEAASRAEGKASGQMIGARSSSARTEAPVLVAFASQTGVASALALRSAQHLRDAGLAVRLEPLGRLGPDDLLAAGRALFLVSTCGEGDAPDEAFGFVRRMSLAAPRLEKVDFAVLALGDRKYSNFCAFGRRLESWLLEHGARPLAERIDVDGHDLAALGRWESLLPGLVGASSAAPTPSSRTAALGSPSPGSPPGAPATSPFASPLESPFESALAPGAFTPWRIALRETMNPKSAGEPVLRLRLVATAHPGQGGGAESIISSWQAGDLAQIEVPTGGLPALREYSIASIPQEGAIELFVRLQRAPDGELGLASRWLSGGCLQQSLEVGQSVPLRLRANPHFRLAAAPAEPLILIGAGSGLAGLRALVKAREQAGARRNWLVFGERSRAHDFLCREEIERWLAHGVLERFDAVFSRDGPERRYVQHRLHEQAAELQRWVGDGASIHVCGSRERLGLAVDQALEQILGVDAFVRLRESGRYRRDVW
jgi:sulfite reductase (NADPH) flavoprotein alpha-component